MEDFDHTWIGSEQEVDLAVPGWTHSAPAVVAQSDGGGFYVTNTAGNSQSKMVTSDEGTFPITDAMRSEVAEGFELSATLASSTNKGMRFVVKIDTTWYSSEQFGFGEDEFGGESDHGAMDEHAVTTWVWKQVNLETSLWYESLTGEAPTGYDWRDGTQWSNDAVDNTGGLPPGDVLQFGIAWKQDTNHQYGALDSFRAAPPAAPFTPISCDDATSSRKPNELTEAECAQTAAELGVGFEAYDNSKEFGEERESEGSGCMQHSEGQTIYFVRASTQYTCPGDVFVCFCKASGEETGPDGIITLSNSSSTITAGVAALLAVAVAALF